jgi:hypothetical protein
MNRITPKNDRFNNNPCHTLTKQNHNGLNHYFSRQMAIEVQKQQLHARNSIALFNAAMIIATTHVVESPHEAPNEAIMQLQHCFPPQREPKEPATYLTHHSARCYAPKPTDRTAHVHEERNIRVNH